MKSLLGVDCTLCRLVEERVVSFQNRVGFFMYMDKLSISQFENVKYGNIVYLNNVLIYFSLGNLRA